MDRWSQIEFFVQVAELGSLSRAAEKLDMSSAAASRILAALEERLGTRLVERTTRRLWLTEAGQFFHQRCLALISDMSEAEGAAQQTCSEASGVLRVTSSVSFAMSHIAPALPEFRRRYPRISVQITAANRYPDFIDAGIDVAIRTREVEGDSGITVRRLARTARVLAASPAYLASHGTPRHPRDLAAHQLLVYTLANDPYLLHFSRGEERCDTPISSMLDSNEGQVICAAGLAGLGIVIQPLYIVHEDIVAGRLVPVMLDWKLPMLSINLAYQSRRYQPAKVRVFNEFLVERFTLLQHEKNWLAPLA